MMGTTHAAAGILAAELVMTVSQAPLIYWPLGIIFGAVAAIVPDIDSPKSSINQRIPTGSLSGTALDHRHFTHSIIATILFSAFLHWLWPMVPSILLDAATAGYLSHILIDELNTEGVQLFWPLPFMVTLSKILPYPLTFPTDSWIETKVFKNVLWIFVILTLLKPTLT